MKRGQIAAAIFFLIVALVIVIATGELEFWSGISPGPRFMALIVAGLLGVLAMLFAWEVSRQEHAGPIDLPQGADLRRVIYLVISIIGFTVLSVPLGLVISAALFILGTLILVLRQPPLPSLLTSVLTVGVIYSIFVAWLELRLPVGMLGI